MQHQGQSYSKFVSMIAVSMLLMFAVMYLNTYQASHAWFSETRLYMTLLMGSTMAAVMLLFMRGMYQNARANLAILLGSVALFGAALCLVRTQSLVDDVDYMEGMIPHHSIAVLTSERAQIEDRRVRELADEILRAQRREIREMEFLIRDIRENGPATSEQEAARRPVPSFSGDP